MNIGVIGKMINKWDKEEKNEMEVLHMKVIMNMEIRKEQVNILGKMELFIMENGKIIKFMDWDFINGLMVDNMLVNGKMLK